MTPPLPSDTAVAISPAGRDHLSAVRSAYSYARSIQRWEGTFVWPEFTDDALLAEVAAGHLYRVMDGDALLGVFSIAYEDPANWGELERGQHVYLHRIARANANAANHLLPIVLAWARGHCRALGRAGLRLDTAAHDTGLVGYYVRQGFHVVGRRRIGSDPRLRYDYGGAELALLEAPLTGRPDDAPAGDRRSRPGSSGTGTRRAAWPLRECSARTGAAP